MRVGKQNWWAWVLHHDRECCFSIRPSRGKDVVEAFLGEHRPDFWVSDRLAAQMGWITRAASPISSARRAVEDRIANLGKPAADGAARSGSWPDILADLNSLTETEVEQDGKRFLLRSPPRPAASLALRAAGVALPPTVRQLADA